MRATVLLATLVLPWLGNAHASAQECIPVQVRGCRAWVVREALESALATEGVRCGVEVWCEDGRLRLGEAEDGSSWELESIPVAVRARVLALLIAERVREQRAERDGDERARDERARESEAESESEAEAETGDESEVEAEAESESESESVADADDDAETTLGIALDPPALSRRAHPGAAFVLHEAPLRGGTGPRFGVGVDALVFLDPATALAGPSLQVSLDALRVEVGWMFGQAGEVGLGQIALMLGHVSVGVSIVCVRWADTSICGSVFGTVGYARADPQPNDPGVMSEMAESVYAGGALEVGAWLATEFVAVNVGLRGGWGYGLVAESRTGELAALGGAWLGAHLAIEVEPITR